MGTDSKRPEAQRRPARDDEIEPGHEMREADRANGEPAATQTDTPRGRPVEQAGRGPAGEEDNETS